MDYYDSKVKYMLRFIYRLSLWELLLVIAAAVIVFGVVSGFFVRKKPWKIICIVLLSLVTAAIVAITLVFRSSYYRGYLMMPFQRLIDSPYPKQVLLEMVQNGLLFVPFGMALPFSISGRGLKKFLITIGVAFAFSLSIELLQYLLSIGYAEGDDLIMNVLGAAVGFLSYPIARAIDKIRNK